MYMSNARIPLLHNIMFLFPSEVIYSAANINPEILDIIPRYNNIRCLIFPNSFSKV